MKTLRSILEVFHHSFSQYFHQESGSQHSKVPVLGHSAGESETLSEIYPHDANVSKQRSLT